MKRIKSYFKIVLLVLAIIVLNKAELFAYTGINSQTLFEPSVFDNLVLNYTTLPEISVSGSAPYTITYSTAGSGHPRIHVNYSNSGAGQNIDSVVTAKFNNCGTLNGRPIDMRLVYSDIVSNKAGSYLHWSAFGSVMMSTNEWWYGNIEHVNVDIYFYYHGETTPIYLDLAYLSLFSEDNGEGASASRASETYLYNTTNMTHENSKLSVNGWRTYHDVYYGTQSGSTEAGSLNCVAFQYRNKDHINVELYEFAGHGNVGYHFQYTPLTSTIPNNPVKSVNKTESQLGDTLTYTINQNISKRHDSSFHYSSLVFSDTIDPNLTYNSFRVYDENGADITNSAGSLNYNNTTRRLTYTFNTSWLNSMPYNGQTYKFEINTTVNSTSTSAVVTDRANVNINNTYSLDSNTVSTTLKAKVITHYVNKRGIKLADDTTTDGNLLDSYVTAPKDIYAYELVSDSGNTSGTMQQNVTEVTYVYDLIRVNIDINKTLEATDSTTIRDLSGAKFKLTVNEFASQVAYANPESTYYSSVTDMYGHCVIEGVPYGTYTIVEQVIPSTAFSGLFYLGASNERINNFSIEINKNQNLNYSLKDVAKKMQITIYKEDAQTQNTPQGDAHLEGARYTLYRDSNCTDAIETLTIAKNADGTYSATSGWYLVGTYYIKEDVKEIVNGTKYSYAEGYLVDERVYTVSQDPDAQTVEHTRHTITSKENIIRNDIVVIKDIGATSNTPQFPLDKCKFTATLISSIGTDHEFSVECTRETDANGYCIIENLPYGRYLVQETTVSPISLRCADFRVFVEKHRTDKVTPYEPKDGTFDSITLGEEIGTIKTYDTTYNWLDANNHIVDVPKVMQIKIRKVDEYATEENHQYTQGDAVLKGAIYEIYRYDPQTDGYTEYVYDITVDHIDEEGYWCANSQDLLVGKYMVKEKIKNTVTEKDGKAYKYSYAEGYLVDEKEYYFESKPDEQTVRVTYHDAVSTEQVIRGRVDAIKYNNNSSISDKNPAEGAVLRLTLDKNPEVYYEGTINKDGYVEWVEEKSREKYYPYTIPYGKYTITEVKASNSGEHTYIYNQKTEIGYSTHTQNYVFSDEYVRMRLTIQKFDAETGEKLLNGATFKIWCVDTQSWYEEMIYPSGEYISEFTTNTKGQLTINGHLEAGHYVLYETKAPEGYYLDENMREGSRGYEFRIGVEADGKVCFYHNDERVELAYEMEDYEYKPTKMYSHTIEIDNMPQKAIVEIEKLANQFTKVTTTNTEYGRLNTPVYEEKGLEGATFKLVAAEDVITPDGTVRYTKGQVVDTVTTGKNGIARTKEVYLGKYRLEEVTTKNGYVLDTTPIEINIEYTTQEEKVQLIKETKKNEKQEVNLSFEKEFKELEVSKFKFENKEAVFGVYTRNTLKNYNNQNVLGQDELVDIMVMDKENKVENSIELPEGSYYVKELKVSSPYIKQNDKYDFSVEYTNTTSNAIELTINNGKVENEAKTSEFELIVYPDVIYDNLEIDKIKDREELEEIAKEYGIEGKTYGIYEDKECTKPVMTIEDEEARFVTDENGIINIPDMPTGTYYLKELVAPFGYEISEEVIKVEIGDEALVLKKAKEPTKKAKLLRKYDTFTKDVIEGVEFVITDEEEKVVYTGITDENGIVEIPIVFFKNGEKYYYQEKAKEGSIYEVKTEKSEFTAKYDEETCQWQLKTIPVGNERKTIEFVKVVKKDSKTGEPLEGCVFTIVLTNKEGKDYVNENGETIYLVKEAVTDENGEYVIENVPYGTYRFEEMVAPEGYEIDEDMTGLTFEANDKTKEGIVFEVTNTGDIAVMAMASILILSVVGITTTILKKKKVK